MTLGGVDAMEIALSVSKLLRKCLVGLEPPDVPRELLQDLLPGKVMTNPLINIPTSEVLPSKSTS